MVIIAISSCDFVDSLNEPVKPPLIVQPAQPNISDTGFVITVMPKAYLVDYKNVHNQYSEPANMDSLITACGGNDIPGGIIIVMSEDAMYSQVILLVDELKNDSITRYAITH